MADDVDTQGNKPISKLVATDGMTRTYELSDNTYEERVAGSASWRHNNPGNLKMEYAHSADSTVHSHRTKEAALASAVAKYPGTIDLDQRGNVIFDTFDHGRDAQISFIKKDGDGKTVAQMLGDYSKPDYSGPTHHEAQEATIYAVGDRAGFDLRTQTIDKMSDAEISALADGVSKFEGFTKGQTQALTAAQAADRQTRAQAGVHQAPAHADGHAHAQANLPHALKHGDKGAEVGAVQQQLRDLGYTDSRGNPIGVDRNFGPTTEAAVKAFQTDHGLTPDGKVGPNTARDLHEQTQSQKDNSLQSAAAPQFNTGSPYMDKLIASVNDPAAFKQAMTDLNNSPTGQAFHAEGRAQVAEMQNQQLQTQIAQQQAPPQVQVQQGPVMTR